jgi:hypothetical protein
MSDPPPGDPPKLDDDLVRELADIATTIAARDDHGDLARRLDWLVDTLVLRGQLPASFRRMMARAAGPRSPVRLATFRDKYAVSSADIDCASRIPQCGARCCTMEVSLSAQDLAEGGIPFDILEPYALPRDPETRKCVCMNADGACTIYERRPGACRAYDCRHDARVWLDFEARIPAP